MLTSLEALLGVINACLPVLKPIFNRMRGAPPKSKSGRSVKEILTSGSIPIFIRVSQMLTHASREEKDDSSDGEILTENRGRYGEEKMNEGSDGKGEKSASVTTRQISPPMTDKAKRVMGIKAPEIHVRKDVDVESVMSRNERDMVDEGSQRRQERW